MKFAKRTELRLGEPGCVSPRKNLTRSCGGAKNVRVRRVWSLSAPLKVDMEVEKE